MIRRSTAIAAAALLLSLLVHSLGLEYMRPVQRDLIAGDPSRDEVALGDAFENMADTSAEPVEPEPAPVPEPPVQTPPEPDLADMPTSEAQVASDDPQDVFAPDAGPSDTLGNETTAPAEADVAPAPVPETVAPAGVDEAESTEPQTAQPVAPEPEVLAALPPTVSPVPPVAPSPNPSAVPVVPSVPEAVEPVPDDPETATNQDATASAVTSSVRPPLQRPLAQPRATQGPSRFRHLENPATMESPLTAYLRGEDETESWDSGGDMSGGLGFRDSPGIGNAYTTNYAGRVLVHLNRAASVPVSKKGFARVMFEINPDGSLAWVDVLNSSGSAAVERAATGQVRNASPFPPPPDGKSQRLSFVYRAN